MTARLIAEPCFLCEGSEVPSRLCVAEMETAHERALEAEGDRLALAFAELGEVPELRLEREGSDG